MENKIDGQFLTTQWTQILNSSAERDDAASETLVMLCQDYYLPVFVFIRNSCGNVDEAHDLCQGFFELMIETRLYRKAIPERGRFRSFILTAVKNYLKNEYRDARRQKRGEGKVHFSVDCDQMAQSALVSDVPPDALFDQQWAATMFKDVWKLLRQEYEQTGQMERFESFRPVIMNPGAAFPYDEVAANLKMSSSAAKSAAFRLKARFRELFRVKVAQLVDSPNEVDEEIQYLIQAMSYVNR